MRTIRPPTTVTPPTTTLPQPTPEQAIARRTTHTCEKHDTPTPSVGDVADEDTSAEIAPIGLPHQRQNLSPCSNPGRIHPLQKINEWAGCRERVCQKAGY